MCYNPHFKDFINETNFIIFEYGLFVCIISYYNNPNNPSFIIMDFAISCFMVFFSDDVKVYIGYFIYFIVVNKEDTQIEFSFISSFPVVVCILS